MLIDSHCHLNFPDLANNIDEILENMKNNEVTHALCVSVNLEDFPGLLLLAESYQNLYASVGVHPDYEDLTEPKSEELVSLAKNPKVIAIGETGLDYSRIKGDLEWQRNADTLSIMAEEGADQIGGVMHCFTESWEVAQKAMEMNFYISFSGIVTFKNAANLKETAKKIPLERMLIETDSPYLAPVPFRGKTNQPAYVRHVAEEIASLRNISLNEVAESTTKNFFSLFKYA